MAMKDTRKKILLVFLIGQLLMLSWGIYHNNIWAPKVRDNFTTETLAQAIDDEIDEYYFHATIYVPIYILIALLLYGTLVVIWSPCKLLGIILILSSFLVCAFVFIWSLLTVASWT